MQLWPESTRYFFKNPVNPDFGLWTPGSGWWSGSSPKFIPLVPGPCPTPPRNFVKIRSQLFQLSDRETDRQTDRQTDQSENITSFFGGGKTNQKYKTCSRWSSTARRCKQSRWLEYRAALEIAPKLHALTIRTRGQNHLWTRNGLHHTKGAPLQNFWVGQILPSTSSPLPTPLPFPPFLFPLPPFPLSRLRSSPVKYS